MKLVKAYVSERKTQDVVLALQQLPEVSGVSICEGKGFGRSRGENSSDKIQIGPLTYIPHYQIEVLCQKETVKLIIQTIEENAQTGLKGDGKIFVCNVEKIVRISDGSTESGII